MATATSTAKSAILIGKTGSGKSHISNRLIGDDELELFKLGVSVKAQTATVQSETRSVEVRGHADNGSSQRQMELKIIDTPGLADTEGRTEQFISTIISEMKAQKPHCIILVVEYGRISKDVYDNLEIIEKCLCGISASSFIVIVNKFPSEAQIKRNKKTKPNFDAEKERSIIRQRISKALKMDVQQLVCFRDDVEKEDINNEKIDDIRTWMSYFSEPISTAEIRTWDEVVKYHEDVKSGIVCKRDALRKQIEELEIRIAKAKVDLPLLERHSKKVIAVSRTASCVVGAVVAPIVVPITYVLDSTTDSMGEHLSNYADTLRKGIPDAVEKYLVDFEGKRYFLEKLLERANDNKENDVEVQTEINKMTSEIERLKNMLTNPRMAPDPETSAGAEEVESDSSDSSD